jgi:hypothetical protein
MDERRLRKIDTYLPGTDGVLDAIQTNERTLVYTAV